MKNKSFAFLYAVRELKLRKKTFIPVICIAAGVMVLMTNILIYIQSRYTTDLNYYKTNTHLIMPALTEEDAERLENLSFVQSVDRTPDGAAFLCFVRLKDEYLTNYVRYADCGVRVMEELRLTRRAPYDNYYFRYQNYRYNRTFICCALFNARYMELLIEPPVFTPAMMTVIFFSFLMHLASVWLVFSMKVRRGQDEFASMRAMGMGLRQLRQINQLEACGITAVLFIPSLAVSAGSVKIVCILSERLYPDFGMNSLLTFDAPWLMIFVSFFSYLFAAYFAVFMVTRSLKTNSVTELLSGTDEKIPFVEQSSTKLINAYDFKPYEKVELRRTFRRNLPPRILFCLLILFPMLFAGILFSIVSVFFPSHSPTSIVYRFESNLPLSSHAVPASLIEHILTLDGVAGVTQHEMVSAVSNQTPVAGFPDTYNDTPLTSSFSVLSPFFDQDESIPPTGTCIAPCELFSVGDIITVGSGKKAYTLTVAEVREGLFHDWTHSRYSRYNIDILISDSTHAAIMGWDEPRYQRVSVHCEKGRETELLPLIEACAGLEGNYVNDHERQLRQKNEIQFFGTAEYIENEIANLYTAFLFTFLFVETGYLLICAGSVIASVTAYEVSGRTKEFSILRALGMTPDSLQKLSAKKQLAGILISIVMTFIILVLTAVWLDSQNRTSSASEILSTTQNGPIETLAEFAMMYLPVCTAALAGYGGSALFASLKTVGAILAKPIAECVKNKE